MKVCVLGLGHLGTVTAACLAATGHQVTGLDFAAEIVAGLRAGQPPLFEPGLADLVMQGLAEGRLDFTTDTRAALPAAEVVWVAYDTPVDDHDRADVEFVWERVIRIFPDLAAETLVLVSSQLPVGSTRRLAEAYAAAYPTKPVAFAYSPENLRLGQAIEAFRQPDRVVAGVRAAADRDCLIELFRPLNARIEWMSVESAEMTKHALNAFLATSVAFMNEVAGLCERVGADAQDVERGLKSDARIGPRAYLRPGAAFAGGTLARDINFLTQLGARFGQPTELLAAVRTSNQIHQGWTANQLRAWLGALAGRTIAVWGLTYKPGTDTLRRSSAVELCRWLAGQGARVRAHDPVVRSLPADLAAPITLCPTPLAALDGAAALVIATEWPDYRAVPADAVLAAGSPVVIDPNRFLVATLGSERRLRYATVGQASAG